MYIDKERGNFRLAEERIRLLTISLVLDFAMLAKSSACIIYYNI